MKYLHKLIGMSILILIFILLSINFVLASGWYPGTLHDHTAYSSHSGYDKDESTEEDNCPQEGLPWDDHVGYTVVELKNQARESNLFWQSFTDHSYCLDSSKFNVVKNDCISVDNADSNYVCLSGEELSVYEDVSDYEILMCSDSLPTLRTAHLGAHGVSSFISQTPAGKRCPTSPTTSSGIGLINNNDGISIINHPFSPIEFSDCEGIDEASGETGIEIWNGGWDNLLFDNEQAFNKWKELLLNGKKVYSFSGTDSHEAVQPLYSYNYAYVSGTFNQANLKSALSSGKSTVSNNGLIYIEVKGENQGSWTMQGSTVEVCSGENVQIRASYSVNNACGLDILKGTIGDSIEYSYQYDVSGSGSKTASNYINQYAYFRAECINSAGTRRIYTNPIWIEIDTTDNDGDGYCSASDCDDSDSAEHPDTAETACSDGKDNDCDGLTDGADSDCGGSGCTCDGWSNSGCGGGSCSSTKMRQTRSCNPSGCNSESRCVDHPSCSASPDECEYDEIEEDCRNGEEERVFLEISDGQAYNTGSSSDIPICGEDDCDPSTGYAIKFDIDDCDGYLDEDMKNDITEVRLKWWNDGGEEDCSDTDLYYYTRDEDDLNNAGNNEEDLTDKSKWDKVNEGAGNCGEGYNSLDITDQYKDDLKKDDDDEIAYVWWPEDDQDYWRMEDAGDPRLDIEYCKPCNDNDGDGYGSDCPLGTDCDDNDYNVNPEMSEICSDGKDNDCDGDTDCADSECSSGVRCGTCKTCSGGICSGTPSDDSTCGAIDCSGWYIQTGTESQTGTETCYNRQDITSNRCEGFGDCKDSNTADCASQSNDNSVYSCGTCAYIAASSCIGATLGSCSFYGTSSECDSNYKCSDSAGGNNAYDNFDYKNPSKGFCDGTGQCDYGSSSPTCTNTEGSEGTSVCADEQSSCQNLCADSIDNDNNGCADSTDYQCGGIESNCADSIDNDCDGLIDSADNTECINANFIIQDSSASNVSSFDNSGNIVLKGTCSQQATCIPSSDSYIFKDGSNNVVAYINSTGDLCIETGDCSDSSASCNPSNDAFIVQDSSDNNVSYIDVTGDLCLTGTLVENGNP